MRLVLCCLLFVLALVAPASASACTVTWTGAAGTTSWNAAGNWSGGSVPTASDSACLPAGSTVVVDYGSTVGSVAGPDAELTVNGALTLADATTPSQVADLGISGGLAGAGSIEATDTFKWTGGTLSGSGDTVVAAGATGTIAPGDQTIFGRTLTNHGTTTWTAGNLTGREGARFVNDGTFHANADNAYIGLYSSGSATFSNTGTLDKTAGTASTSLYLPVTNTGTINGAAGTLNLGGGGGGDGGSWTGKLNLSSGTFTSAAMTLAGTIEIGGTVNAGHVDGPNARVTVQQGTFSVAEASTVSELVVSGGTVSGAGTLTATDTFRWTAGTLSGTGETVIGQDATGTITLPAWGSEYIDGRTLTNRGTTTWTAGSITGKNNARIVNDGTLHANADGAYIGLYSTNSASFRNDGTVDKTAGTGSVSLSIPFTNADTVDVQAGTLSFAAGGGADTGTGGAWTTGADGHVNFSGGTFKPDAMTLSGNIDVTNAGTVDAGHVTGPDARVTVQQGSFSVGEASSVAELVVSGGAVSGAGTLTATDLFRWTSGTLAGSGETVIGPAATGTITLPTWGSQDINGRTLTNHGTTTWTAGSITGKNDARIVNAGTLHANADAAYIGLYTTNSASFRNDGTVDKTAGSGSVSLSIPFTNAGTVDVQTGTLYFAAGGGADSEAGGTWTTSAGGHVNFSGGTFKPEAMTLSGNIDVSNSGTVDAGHVDGPDATLTVAQGSFGVRAAAAGGAARGGGPSPDALLEHLELSGGTFDGSGQLEITDKLDWSSGTMAGTGETVIDPDALAQLNLSGYQTLDTRTFTNRGTVAWNSGGLYGKNGATIENFNDFRANSESGVISQYSTNSMTFRNHEDGTLEKLLGTGSTAINAPLTSVGQVRVGEGQLNFTGGDITGEPSGGDWCALADGNIMFSSGRTFTPVHLCGRIQIGNGGTLNASQITGDADVSITYGGLNVTGTGAPSYLRSLTMSGGTLARAGQVVVESGLNWTGGEMRGAGETVLGAGATSTISPSDYVKYEGLLRNDGALTWSSGGIYGLNAPRIVNTGTFRANSPGSIATWTGPVGTLINPGTFRKSTGTDTTSVQIPVDNDGAITAGTGKLDFSGGGTPTPLGDGLDDPLLCPPTAPQTGSWGSTGSGSIDLSQGCFKLAGGTVMTGTVNVNGAKVLAGAIQGAAATLYASSGTLSLRDPASDALVQNLYVSGTVTGPGSIRVCGNMTWQAGTMSGTGATEICPGGTGQINPPGGQVTLRRRTLANHGTLTWSQGGIHAAEGAVLFNDATFVANAESSSLTVDESQGAPIMYNRGSVTKTAGPGITQIEALFGNEGTTSATTGEIRFRGRNADRDGDDDEDDTNPGARFQIEGEACESSGTATLSAARARLFGKDTIILAGHAGVVCPPDARASGTGTVHASPFQDWLLDSIPDTLSLAASAKPCGPSTECTVRFGAALHPGDPGYNDPDYAQFYRGIALFAYTPSGTGGPAMIGTPVVSAP